MEDTKIQWCDHTFNPWEGCTKVSPGCVNCYAESRNHRFGLDNWGKGKPRRLTSDANWKQPVRWNDKAERNLKAFFAWADMEDDDDTPPPPRPRVFCASLADWLDEEVPIEWLARLLKLIHDTPNLDWLNLTKRPENFFPRLRLAVEWLQKEPNYGTQAKRIGRVSSRSVRGDGNRQAGTYLEGQKAAGGSMERRDENIALQAGESRDHEWGRIPSGASDARFKEASRRGAQIGLASLQGANTAGHDCQSQERKQDGQPNSKFRIGKLQPAATSLHQRARGEALGLQGTEPSQDETNKSGRSGDTAAAGKRGNDQGDSHRLRDATESSRVHCDSSNLEASDLIVWLLGWINGKPPSNVWIGISVEDQKRADERIPLLLEIPARVRFLSVEPMLGPVEFSDVTKRCETASELGKKALDGIHWVIFGGESGRNARPCNIEWIRDGVRQCREAGVKVFVKQLGAKPYSNFGGWEGHEVPLRLKDRKGGDCSQWPEDLRVREFPAP